MSEIGDRVTVLWKRLNTAGAPTPRRGQIMRAIGPRHWEVRLDDLIYPRQFLRIAVITESREAFEARKAKDRAA